MTNKRKLSTEEVIKDISKDKMNAFNKLGHSYVAIRKLIDFIQVLEKNEKDYIDEINIKICKDTDIHPSDILSHYIVLEACNFYEVFSHMKKRNSYLPDLPSYFDKLKKVRNKVIAHKDNREEFPFAEDVINMLNELSKEATIEKIIKDVYHTFNSVKNFLETPNN